MIKHRPWPRVATKVVGRTPGANQRSNNPRDQHFVTSVTYNFPYLMTCLVQDALVLLKPLPIAG